MRELPNKKNERGDAYHYSYSKQLFSCDFTTSEIAGNVEFHMHNRHEIYYLLDGYVQYFVENVCYTLSPGDLILFSSNEIHKAINMSKEPFSRLVIHINPDFVQQYCTPSTNLLSCFHRKPGVGNLVSLEVAEQEELLRLARSFKQYLTLPDTYGSDILAATYFFQILVLINHAWSRTSSRSAIPTPHRVQAIMDYVDQHLTEPLTLDSIAAALSLDKYYLSHLFKSETESSIFQYVLVRRVALAKQLLSQGHTVSEACHLAGFNDYSNFIRSFKQITGYTPGQFKRGSR